MHGESMNHQSRAGVAVVAGLCMFLSFGALAGTQTSSPVAKRSQKETMLTKHATGTFEVKMAPQTDDKVGDPTVGRMSLDKVFRGDIEGVSRGQMSPRN